MNKAERIIAYIMQQLSMIGENFGWQIGRIGANYENGYMKSNQDCKAHFRKEKIKKDIEAIINDHSSEVTGMVVTNADRIRNMSDEELAEFIPIGFDCVCNPNYECIETVIVHGECGKQKECLMNWLKEKVE